jgi:hypothetical protein
VTQATELFDENAGTEQPGSLRDRLLARRKEISENRTVDIDLPGYDGLLYVRYHLLDGPRLNEIATKVIKTTKDRAERGLLAAIDTLIAATVEFRVRDGGRDKALAEEIGDSDLPVGWDQRLARWLEIEDDIDPNRPARSIVLSVFLYNDVAIAAHNQKLSRWMMGNNVSVDEELMEAFS